MRAAACAALLLAAAGGWLGTGLHRAARVEAQADILEHFKYGAVGTEERAGVPYWIWRVLPVVFEDKLPKRPGRGWERLGFIYERPDAERPIGITHVSGFISGAGAERDGVKFDTRLKGNQNTGHTYGRQLTRAERDDLLEFLKTL